MIGEERAALIDSGLGAVEGLHRFVQTLTDKPVICILTHGHPDHAGGAVQFPEVYMSPLDEPELAWGLTAERRLADLTVFSGGDEEVQAYAQEHHVDCTGFTYQPMQPGDIFDLGGVTLEILAMSGHTKGSVAVVNRAEGYIFTGDAVSGTLMLTGYARSCVEESFAALKALVQTAEEIGCGSLYAAHYADPVPLQMAIDLRDACAEILAGEVQGDPRTHFKFAEMNDPNIVLFAHRKGSASVTYNGAILQSPCAE